MKKLVVLSLLVGMFSGCYTQLITRKVETAPPVQSISFEIDSLTGDTVKVVRQVDTVVERDDQHCYWIQNIWGEPELRCDNSYYSQSWYQYNNYPWWYGRNTYDSYYGSNYYYRRGFYNPYFNRRGRYDGGSGRTVDTGNGNPRRTSSSAVLKNPTIYNSNEKSSRNQGTIIIKSSDDASNPPVTMERRRRTSSTGISKTITATPIVPPVEQAPVTKTPKLTRSPVPPSPQPKVNVPPAPTRSTPNDNTTNRRKPARRW